MALESRAQNFLPDVANSQHRNEILSGRCRSFIADFSRATFSDDTGLTPRTSSEVLRLLQKGHGEIAFTSEGEPAAILLTPEIMTYEGQAALITALGYPSNEVDMALHNGRVIELSGSWVPEGKRGNGHYRRVKQRTMRLLERFHPEIDDDGQDTIVIASNARRQPPALTAPENGQAPLPFDRYPLTTTLVSFVPDELHTTRHIPDKYTDILWKTEREIADLIGALGRRATGQKNALKDIEIDEPTVYVMMRSGYSFGRMIATNVDKKLNYHLYVQNAMAEPVEALRKLEQHLYDLVIDSPLHRNLPPGVKQYYVYNAMERVDMAPFDPSFALHDTPASRSRVETLVVQQVLLDALRMVNQVSAEKRVAFNSGN